MQANMFTLLCKEDACTHAQIRTLVYTSTHRERPKSSKSCLVIPQSTEKRYIQHGVLRHDFAGHSFCFHHPLIDAGLKARLREPLLTGRREFIYAPLTAQMG